MRLGFSASRALELEPVLASMRGFDALRLSEAEVLLTDDQGLWVFDLRFATRRPFLAHALDDRIDALERDERGRIWGLGERLHLLGASGSVKSVALPFMNELPRHHWPVLRRMAISGHRIIVPLSERGLLVVDADRTAA